jgi:hypothetical protein
MKGLGRLLVTAAIVGTGPSFAWFDLNRTHIFNPRWTPHARFHDASAVVTEVGWSIASLWLLWRRGTRDQRELALKISERRQTRQDAAVGPASACHTFETPAQG